MKINKILIVVQTFFMYLLQLPIIGICILANLHLETELENKIGNILGYIFISAFFLGLLICLINVIFAFLSILKPRQDLSKLTMICKIIQIPCYVFNFIISSLLFIGTLNPFLIFTAPIFLIFLILMTYSFMFSTSLPQAISFIRGLLSKEIPFSILNIVASIFMFFFTLDLIGSILMYSQMTKLTKVKTV